MLFLLNLLPQTYDQVEIEQSNNNLLDPYARPAQKAASAQVLLRPGVAPSKANLLQANKENINKVNILREQLHQLKDRHKLIHEAIVRYILYIL